MRLVVWVLSHHENKDWNKHVESTWFPRSDEGSTPSSSTNFLLYITDCQSVGDIFVYIKLHEFAFKGKTVSQTEPVNDLFVLLIELDEDENGNFPMQE